MKPVPVLLGGLLRASENVGPGEVAAKHPHTYQFCVWQAEKLGIPIRFPEHHPFLTVTPQRLLAQQNADWAMVERAFDYVWIEGKDPNLSWPDFCAYLGLPADTPKPDSPDIKALLIANTKQAREDGAFGVPALIVKQHCFWGLDTIDWTLDYLARPQMFEEASYAYAANVPNGLL
ncbi:DsbA family protein [Polynucleobacter necessarius]|uniref:DsbA family protein n=1 Tax=Polynucleobacter necessarius TaxID=576610 RepID=UPI0022B25373|nr:DsbA family protein [Polynucleobacter necessarius]